jgi:mono/diheme cytochrome c family protein
MRYVRIGSALILLTVLCASVVGSESGDEPPEQSVRGALLYRIHCQNCHGDSGEGDGPMAKLLTIRPADLTVIARNNEGAFPSDKIHQTIDGRADVRAHGMREMPVWGLSLQQTDRDSSQNDEIRARVDDLVAHLKSIQDGRD